MTRDEQIAVCKAIAVSCMWGYSGIGHVILEEFEKRKIAPGGWLKTFEGLRQQTERDHVGVVSDRKEYERLQAEGYLIARFSDGVGFMDKHIGGLYKYLSDDLVREWEAERKMWEDAARHAVWPSRG